MDWLAAHCLDPQQREEIERMLSADTADDDWLPGDAVDAARVIGEAGVAAAMPPGSRINAFELIEVLGEAAPPPYSAPRARKPACARRSPSSCWRAAFTRRLRATSSGASARRWRGCAIRASRG